MLVTLTNEEVRDALCKAAEDKTQHVLGLANDECCYFNIQAGGVDIKDIECVEFVVDFN